MKTEFQLKGEISWTATIRTAGIGVHTLWMSHMSCLLQGGLTLPTNLWSPAKTLHAKSQETNPTFESRVGCNLLYVTPHITWILQFPSFQFLRGWCLNPKHWKVPLKSTTIDWTLKENYLWTNRPFSVWTRNQPHEPNHPWCRRPCQSLFLIIRRIDWRGGGHLPVWRGDEPNIWKSNKFGNCAT